MAAIKDKHATLKITIGLPSNGFIRVETALSVVVSVTSSPNCLFKLEAPVGCYIHQLRKHIATEAIKCGSSHLMFIDSDMVFPSDGIAKLLHHNKPIIGADYNYKFLPKRSITKLDPDKLNPAHIQDDPDFPGNKLIGANRPKEPFEVRAVGTGFMLIQTWVFEKIPQPWFWFEHRDNEMVGEDTYFCDRARENGISVWCDPTIPIEHIGTARY